MRARAMDFGAQAEGVFDKLRRIEAAVAVGVVAQRVPDLLMALHAIAPDGSPVGFAEGGGRVSAERLEAFGFDSDERRRRGNETIENRMTAARPRETNRRFDRQRTGGPSRVRTTRQRGQLTRPVEKEPERVDGQRGRGFRVVELAAADLIAGSSVQDALDVQTGNARQEPVSWLRGRRCRLGNGVAGSVRLPNFPRQCRV